MHFRSSIKLCHKTNISQATPRIISFPYIHLPVATSPLVCPPPPSHTTCVSLIHHRQPTPPPLPPDITTGENVIETLVSEGLVQVRRDNLRDSAARLVELEDTAKAAGKGKWAANASVSGGMVERTGICRMLAGFYGKVRGAKCQL